MKVKPLRTPLKGEHIVGVIPTMKPQDVQAGWLKRLNLFTGRTLTETALEIEQRHRAGRLAIRGQMRSPGATTGLNVGLEIRARGTAEVKHYIRINPGMGLTIHGEEVVVPKELRIDAEVLKPQAQSAGILVLEPISIEEIGRFNQGEEGFQSDFTERFFSDDPCELDPTNDAFEDWQWVDGVQVKLFPWPSDWRPQPAFGSDVQWWNRLAYTIFEAEKEQKLDEFFPWEEVGVPIALIGFNAKKKPLFVDQAAVVRTGGRSKSRTPWIPGIGNRFLWRAQIDQLSEQLSDPLFLDKSIDELSKKFRYLPPTGILPKEAIDARTGKSHFFPPNYQIDAVPIPFEQLNVAMQASASLSPYDLFTTDQVRFLVPIPQAWYEPDLLQVEEISPAFEETIDRFIGVRAEWLQRREDVRTKASALHNAITGKSLEFPTPDPEATDDEIIGNEVLNPNEILYGTDESNGILTVPVFSKLAEDLNALTLKQEERDELPKRGAEKYIEYLEDKANRADDVVNFGFLRVHTDIYRIRQFVLGNEAATRLAVNPSLAAIAKGETAIATQKQVANFYEGLKKTSTIIPETSSAENSTTASGESGGDERILEGSSLSSNLGLSKSNVVDFQNPLLIGNRIDIGRPISSVRIEDTTLRSIQDTIIRQSQIQPLQMKTIPLATPVDVVGQQSIPGKAFIRTTSIAERIELPKAPEAKDYSNATKHDVVKGLASLDISLEGLKVPGLAVKNKFDDKTGQPVRTGSQDLKEFTKASELKKILQDPSPKRDDEAAFFIGAVELADHTIATLRIVEGRIKEYRTAIALVVEALKQLRQLSTQAQKRLIEIADELSIARHDVSVARALLAEETVRVKAINDRRDQIIDQYVQVVAYQRPRHGDTILPAPERILDPGLAEPPVPACLGGNLTPSAELEEMLDLLRDSPVKWFPAVNFLLNHFRKLPIYYEIFQSAQIRQTNKSQRIPQAINKGSSEGRVFGQTIGKIYSTQQKVVSQHQIFVKQFDLNILNQKSWQWVKDTAKDVVSLGDLIEGSHRNSVVVGAASDELKNISTVAACLHAGFSDVLPVIRLGWAERLSQHDEPINLRNLASLPRWHEIDRLERRELQTLIDWLYRRINVQISEAVDFMNDLVRIIILLASHAPVDQIIGGRLPAPVKIKPGTLIDVTAFDLSKVNIGMHVFMYGKGTATNQPTISARGVVEDIAPTGIATRILEAASPSLELEENTRIQFSNSNAFNVTFVKSVDTI